MNYNNELNELYKNQQDCFDKKFKEFNQKLNNFIDEQEKFLKQMTKDIKSLNCTNRELNDSIYLKDEKISKLKKSLIDKEEYILRLNDKINNMSHIEGINQFLENHENKYNTSLKEESCSNINNKNQIESISDDNIIKKYKQDIELLYENIQNKNIENSVLKGMIEDNKQDAERLLTNNNNLNESILKKDNELIQLNKNLSLSNEKISLLENIIEEKNNSIEVLNNEISVLKNIINEKDRTISLLRE